MEFTLPAEVAPGTYRVFSTLVKRNPGRGPSIPVDDALASDVREIELSP